MVSEFAVAAASGHGERQVIYCFSGTWETNGRHESKNHEWDCQPESDFKLLHSHPGLVSVYQELSSM